MRHFEKGLSKSLKKVKFIFFFQNQSLLMLMGKVIKNKRGLELVTSCSSGHKASSEKSLYLLYVIWPSLIMWCKAVFELSRNYICKFMHVNSWHQLFHFHLSFWIWKVRKGREKLQKFEYLENEKSFLDEIKNIFHSF